jgi:hypothetical protein
MKSQYTGNLQYKCTTRTRQPMTYGGESTFVFQIAKTFFFPVPRYGATTFEANSVAITRIAP